MNKKNSNVLNLKSIIKSNQKISSIYSIFKNSLKPLYKKKLIVAVSGGPDSLCLAVLTKVLQSEKKMKVFFVLVDHAIRKNSKREAIQVKKILKKQKINITILTNDDEKIEKNIQSNARKIRYKLLSDFSRKVRANHILTAHHSDDQVETFLIRLSRGSGVQGLSSMKFITKLDKKINLVRPLLDFKKKDLIFITKKIFVKVIKDPSNNNPKYLRTRIRHLKKILEKNGIHYDQVIKSIKNLASANETLKTYTQKVFSLNVKKKPNEFIVNYKKLLLESSEIQFKVISEAIKIFSKSYYPPRSIKVLNIIKLLNLKKQKKFTLSRCLITKTGNYLSIKKEA